MDSEQTIKEKINESGYEYDALSTEIKKYLFVIENAIEGIFERQSQAKKLLVNSNLSQDNLSSLTSISRKTLYNHEVLRRYINCRKKDFEKSDVLSSIFKMEVKIVELNAQIKVMILRDIEIEELKSELKGLIQKIKDRDEEIKRLNKRNVA